MKKKKYKIEFFQGRDKKHYFRVIAPNGRNSFNQGYSRQSSSKRAFNDLVDLIQRGDFEMVEGEGSD